MFTWLFEDHHKNARTQPSPGVINIFEKFVEKYSNIDDDNIDENYEKKLFVQKIFGTKNAKIRFFASGLSNLSKLRKNWGKAQKWPKTS